MEHAAAKFARKNRITTDKLPHFCSAPAENIVCSRCLYVNSKTYKFCTNCGYPLKEGSAFTVYNIRAKQRNEKLINCERRMQAARIALYVLGLFFLTGLLCLFSNYQYRIIITIAFLIGFFLFFVLARLSLHNSFTAFLTGLIIILAFSIIFIFGGLTNVFTTVQGLYGIIVSGVLIYFMIQGIKAAYKSYALKEELEIF